MFRHYLLSAMRGFAHHKLYTSINVLGLSVALACVIFVVQFVRHELSYDSWIPETRHLYRVESTLNLPGRSPIEIAATSYPIGVAISDRIPGVTGVTHLFQTTMTLTQEDRQFSETAVDFVDSNFFSFIRLPFIEGDPKSAFSEPESVVLSQSAAIRYFGRANPIGRTLTTNTGGCPNQGANCLTATTATLRVTGIVRDLPQNTQLNGDVFIPTASLTNPDSSSEREKWLSTNLFTYIRLAPELTPDAVHAAVPAVLDQNMTGAMRETGFPGRPSELYAVHLTPFNQVHLDSARWRGNLSPPGSWNILLGVMIVGALILLLACVNFTNLATARAALRAREIGLRKTLGATRTQLAIQFLSEAVLLALMSMVCAMAAAQILLPLFNGLLEQSIALNYTSDWKLFLMLIAVAIGAGLISGIYPALLLSSRRPLVAMQAQGGSSQNSIGLRDVLVLGQFAVSIGLGIAALVVFRQVNYAQELDLGFRWDNIVVVRNKQLADQRQEAFAESLRANPNIMEVGLSQFVPFVGGSSGRSVQLPGQPSKLTMNFLRIDPNYPLTYNVALLAGRLLSSSRGEDRFTNASEQGGGVSVLVNVAGARSLGFTPQEAIEKTLVMNDNRARIVGVLADTKAQGALQPAAPSIYAYVPGSPMDFSVRLNPGHIPQALDFIDRTWHAFVPTVAIQRSFLSASFEKLYRSYQRQGRVFAVFVIIAIFIACLGLYGLVVFTAERRTMEVAVRKILGARTRDIMAIMLWRISLPVLLANLVAWPVAYYYLQRWLQTFTDHIGLNPGYFLVSGVIALFISWATVFLHTLRLSRMSPIHALRTE
jgi:putative ABC transport system permease protein